MHRFAIGTVLLGALACQGISPRGGPPVPAGECHVEIANQTAVPISVTVSGQTVRNLGTIVAGGAVRYDEDCRVGTIRVVANIKGLPPGVGVGGRSPLEGESQFESRSEVQTARPRPGELTFVVFRDRRVRRF